MYMSHGMDGEGRAGESRVGEGRKERAWVMVVSSVIPSAYTFLYTVLSPILFLSMMNPCTRPTLAIF
jgi:hypothetical protein